jgi:cell shape-determining protein MreD
MQRLITLGFMVDMLADVAAILSNSTAALTASLVLGALPAAAALCKFVLGTTGNEIAQFRAEPIRR